MTRFKTIHSPTQICKLNSDICQLRLDFDRFDIAQPDATANDGNNDVDRTQCLQAQFTATSEDVNVPVLCGTNTGMHSKITIALCLRTLLHFSKFNSWENIVPNMPNV